RQFLGAAIAGLAATPSRATSWWESGDASAPRQVIPARPDTLFLTWQRDPTTTMTAQWLGTDIGPAKPVFADALRGGSEWRPVTPRIRPFPMTELSVFRTEMTGLMPGTEYQLRVGVDSPPVRFRTMPARATDAFHFVSGGDCGVNQHAVNNNIVAA